MLFTGSSAVSDGDRIEGDREERGALGIGAFDRVAARARREQRCGIDGDGRFDDE